MIVDGEKRGTIWTIGHSTRPVEEFIELLRINRIEVVADVRRFPASRRYPQYKQAELRLKLESEGVGYLWLPALGGRRQPLADSPNDAWRNEAFRGYADHIATEEFASGLFDLLGVGEGARTTVMCSEAVWWRCHRSLIADVLCSIGVPVLHILNRTTTTEHPYTSAARVVDGVLSYARETPEDPDQLEISLLT